MTLGGFVIVVLGGDSRELYLSNILSSMGAKVVAVGYDQKQHHIQGEVIYSLSECDKWIDAIILPFPGADEKGNVKAKYTNRNINYQDELDNLTNLPLTLVGNAPSHLKEYYESRKGTLIEVAEMDEIAILNSIPTAEGAISLAIDNTPFTIHGCFVLVLGFGRCGITIVNLLLGLNAEVTVVARRACDLARAREMGVQGISFDDFYQGNLQKYQMLFNTVPAMVIDEEVINKLSQEAVIIDIASGEGGTDFKACNRKQIKAIHAKGLPGIYAPETAAKILTRIYPRVLETYLGR